MSDMRKLLDTVQPLFESYAAKDQIYDRYEDLSAHKDNPEVKKHLDKANQCWKDKDIQGCMDALKAGEALVAPKQEAVVTENVTEYIEELHNIMDQLGELSAEARAIVESIDPSEVRRLDAYGAFDFGSSRNPYDTTLAGFIEDLESGQYDERD
jgi:tetrahydromethanopterin S-methyltransferase subunit B